MRLIDDILYIEYTELQECGVSENTLKSAKLRMSSSWRFIDDPEDNRRVLIEYEKLGNSYKEKIKARFGNPYDHLARQPIKNMVRWDSKAEAYYLAYRYDGMKTLPTERVQKYAKAASWLNMLKEVTEDKRTLKKLLNISIDSFYSHVMELIKIEEQQKVNGEAIFMNFLPSSYRRLLAKCKEYNEGGYATLISNKWGNQFAAKVNDEKSESILLEMLNHANQYDDVFICQQYNIWAQANGYKTIDAPTVGVHRRKNLHLLTTGREGNAAFNDKYTKQVKGMRPSAPLYMVESDDNHLDLLFIDPNDESSSKYSHRYKAIVVTDSYNDYVLGYAYAENLSIELVKAAYMNAMYHIRSLTGAWHLPHEVKTDRWAEKTLTPFYESLGNYIPAALGNKHRGYIEQVFGSAHWKRCLKAGAMNYTGNNITALKRGVNAEVVAKLYKDRPLIGDESIAQVEQFFYRLRCMPQGNGKSKQEQWLEAWNRTDNKRPISDEQFLLKLGIEHNYHGEGIQITNRGVEPRLMGMKRSYDLDEYALEHIGKSVSIMYDPYDLSRVLATDFDKVRLMGRDARLAPRALADAQTDSRTYLNSILAEKKEGVQKVAAASERRKKVIEGMRLDADTVLVSGMVTKEIKQQAEQQWLEQQVNPRSNEDYNVFDQI